MDRIRNFSIIAHIDHGKSTLADRFIQVCGGLSEREMAEQVLDSMDLERERGITIKMHAITMKYKAKDRQEYTLNLIDTPGHVDFGYEVSRALQGCEGAVLVVDATQGIEAQTLANLYAALEADLEIIPVINKIDLPSADIERTQEAIDAELGLDPFEAAPVSAKTGAGIEDLLAAIVEKLGIVCPVDQGPPEALSLGLSGNPQVPDFRSLWTRFNPDDSDETAVRFSNEYGVPPKVLSGNLQLGFPLAQPGVRIAPGRLGEARQPGQFRRVAHSPSSNPHGTPFGPRAARVSEWRILRRPRPPFP